MRTVQLNYKDMLRLSGYVIGWIVVVAMLTEVLLLAGRQKNAMSLRDCTAIIEQHDRLSCFDSVTKLPTWPAKGGIAPRVD